MTLTIPSSHRDLLNESICGVLTTMLPNGQPQCSVVWVDYDGEHLLLNTTLERRKTRNMQSIPCVTVLVIDPDDTSRWVEVRGRVIEITTDGAEAHADRLTARYTGKAHFYGDIYPVERRQSETRVIVRIEPHRVTLDAIFR